MREPCCSRSVILVRLKQSNWTTILSVHEGVGAALAVAASQSPYLPGREPKQLRRQVCLQPSRFHLRYHSQSLLLLLAQDDGVLSHERTASPTSPCGQIHWPVSSGQILRPTAAM